MARFTFGKNKKRLEEANTSYADDTMDSTSPSDQAHDSPVSSPVASPVLTKKQPRLRIAPAITINGTTPWKRHKLVNSPFPRYRHSAAAVASDKNEIFLMGGLKEGSVFGDTWKITPQGLTLDDEITGYEASNIEVVNLNNPPARVGHSSVLCGNAYIIYGGDTVDTDFNGFPDNNFYLFNINNSKYTIPSHVLNKPNGRYGHTIGVISLHNTSSKLFLFGGQLENDVFNDLYFFELNTFKSPKARWELIEPLNNFKPPPLTNHSLSVYKNKIYVFGGVYNNEKISNDLWCFDALISKWIQVTTTGNVPPPVNEHASCIVNDKLFVYGGNDFSGIIYNSLYVLDLHTLVWSKLIELGEKNGPGPRCGHSMTYLPKFNKLLIMGGDKNDYTNSDPNDFETYELYNGEEYGTMIYELDLDIVEHFLSSNATSKAAAKSPTKKMAASAAPITPAAGDDSRNNLLRHARSYSAGPDDFKTPNVSPERTPKIVTDSEIQSKQNDTLSGDTFVDVDVPSGNISERDISVDDQKDFVPSDDEIPPMSQLRSRGALGNNSTLESNGNRPKVLGKDYNYISSNEDLRQSNNATPVLERNSEVPSSSISRNGQEDSKIKKLVNELTNELNDLKASTKVQMQNATEKISLLEQENASLREDDKSINLKGQLQEKEALLSEKDNLIYELKRQIDPASLAINEDESTERGITAGGISELSKYKLERLELNNRLIYLEDENSALTAKFADFEPFMNNQIGQLSNFQRIIKAQEEKISKLSSQVKDQEPLHREINDWKNKFLNLQLEFDNYKTINADDQFSDSDGERFAQEGEEVNRSIASNTSASKKSKKEIASHLESLITLWSARSASEQRDMSGNINPNSESSAMVTKLQKQLDDLLKISKQQEMGSSNEIQSLKNELNIKLQHLKTFEENYRDALQSVNNTSKALNLTQDELNNQRIMMEKLIKENNELKLFRRASRRVSARTPIINEEQFGDSGVTSPAISETSPHDDEAAISNAHYNMKVKDLEADLYILKQERDQLKDNVTSLQKELYLSQNSQ
ncbi:unnamed protein product [Debaryomyces fabryi]|nr:unnamed protein product [Debaryomyces fabryi]